MVRALLFDLGNVLIHFSHERMCRQIGELVCCDGEQVRQLLLNSGLFARYERGELTTPQVHEQVERLFERTIPIKSLSRAASDIFWRNKSIEPLIDRLAACGYKLVLLSNTCDAHIRWLDARMRVLRHFKRRVLSFEVGACKPQPAIFQAASRLAGVHPNDCFFTDDTPSHVEAARALGFDAVVYQHAPQLAAELRSRGIPLDA